MSLVVSAKTYSELENKINSDLLKISNWLREHKLIVNSNKCNYMLMGCPLKSTELNITLEGKPLKRVYETKILGVIFDHDLRFDNHINAIYKKISQKISLLTRLRQSLKVLLI